MYSEPQADCLTTLSCSGFPIGSEIVIHDFPEKGDVWLGRVTTRTTLEKVKSYRRPSRGWARHIRREKAKRR